MTALGTQCRTVHVGTGSARPFARAKSFPHKEIAYPLN